jgi:hypothetical protein
MNVSIKTLYALIELKNTGMELEIRAPEDNAQLGDCYVTTSGLTWCKGKIPKRNGVPVSWEVFIEICKSKDTLKAALNAAKAVKPAKPVKKVTKTVI